ncbi:ATP phosphoribosyltransferase [Methanomassiliicoccus luminyensis]|uniref:ATP phosphoribosyltransferase n=1 Tax=Methanomassiliicoccus luminyensis TaxID=1080712 RepID=UPI00037CE514|nr:ATP phosphoribosyltransferase [Methanomassiliicoccus luminyensis]
MSIKLAVPNKGRLNERSLQILKQAGLEIEDGVERKLYATVKNGDFSVMFLRASDIVSFVHKGAVDMGITGRDLVLESGLDVEVMLDMGFGRCRLSVAVPEEAGMEEAEDVPDGALVATSFPNMARKYFAKLGKKVDITVISGAAEVTPRLGVADLIVDLVSSGSTLKTNHLKEIAVIAESEAVVIASKRSLEEKGEEMRDLASALRSVADAEDKKYLMADVPVTALDDIRKFLPGIAGPTIMNIVGRDDVVAIHVVVDKSKIYDSVNKLKRLGATGILIMPIDRMVP